MKNLLLMMTFFTRLPVAYPYEYKEEDFIKGIKYMPFIGLMIGALIYIPTFLGSYLHRPMIILGVWSVYLVITGCLHLDGLADTFDGIFSYRSRDEMLVIMKDSRIGTFGVLSMLWLLLVNLCVSYYVDDLAILLVPIVGRCAGLISASRSVYARKNGMGGAFIQHSGWKEGLLGFTFAVISALVLLGFRGILPVLLTFLFILFFTKRIHGVLGGMTGDTIGAMIEISQTLFMIFFYLFGRLV